MELVIWKNSNTLYTKIFETHTKGNKKEAIVIKSNSTLIHAFRVAKLLILNHKWFNLSAVSDKHTDTIKPVKRYYNKSNKAK